MRGLQALMSIFGALRGGATAEPPSRGKEQRHEGRRYAEVGGSLGPPQHSRHKPHQRAARKRARARAR